MTLADFILQRIAEDEAAAREAIAMRDRINFIRPPEVPDLAFEAWEDAPVPFVAVGPERVLAECEARRRIVGEHEARWITPENWWACDTCGTPGEYDVMSPCPTLRLLALPYADHQDHREEWRP
jgi:hypothetical protein